MKTRPTKQEKPTFLQAEVRQASVDLSVVIPAYNEEHRISSTVGQVIEYLTLQEISSEVILVNDGSQDRTGDIMEQLVENYQSIHAIHLPENRGKGNAVRCGVLAAKGAYILFSDADLSTPVKEVSPLLSCLEDGYDIAIASRTLADSLVAVPQPWSRQVMGKVFRVLSKCVIQGISDTQCGFKAFRRECAYDIFSHLHIERWCFDIEVLCMAQRRGYRIREVPVRWMDSKGSKIKKLRDSLGMLCDLLRIRYHLLHSD